MPILMGREEEEDADEDPRYNRFAEYCDEMMREEEESWQEGNCELMVNRLLNNFFKEWTNSELFHVHFYRLFSRKSSKRKSKYR